jgi:hypothetical protein
MPFVRSTVVLILLTSGANAMTGADFFDRLTDQRRADYVDGAIEMLAYTLPDAKAKCVFDWYYRGRGPEQLIGALKQHRELPVTGVLQVLVKRLC